MEDGGNGLESLVLEGSRNVFVLKLILRVENDKK
jgi:hypothetical protein